MSGINNTMRRIGNSVMIRLIVSAAWLLKETQQKTGETDRLKLYYALTNSSTAISG